MSTFYFTSGNLQSFAGAHKVLKQISDIINLSDLHPILTYGESIYHNWPLLQERISLEDLKNCSFFDQTAVISPKMIRRNVHPKEKIFVIKKPQKTIEIVNEIEFVNKNTKLYENSPARDTIFTIDGSNFLLHFLYNLAEQNNSPENSEKR